MTIYIVSGESGSHDDHIQWTVKAFVNRKVAVAYMRKAQRRANELCKVDWITRTHNGQQYKNEFDPHMRIVDDEVTYSYYPVELDQTELS